MKVFLSSTARDLGSHRAAVYRAIQRYGCVCIRMEDFGARDWEADVFCRTKIAECDVLVGLVGGLYGSSPPGSQTSFTEREYEAAIAAGIPRLIFLASDDFPLPRSLHEPDELFQRQDRFRDRVRQDRIVDVFDGNPDTLATQVVTALRHLERDKEPKVDAREPRNSQRAPAPDLAQVRERYLAHLVERYRYLDFKGFGVSDRVAIRLPLLEMYVPLKARLETPEGETWERLLLAGRTPSEDEAEAMGRKLGEPQPVLDLLASHDGLVLLGDPGSGKTTFLKYLALTLATGQGETLGLGGRLPVLLPLSAYANALVKEDIPLGRFLPRYHQEQRGLDLPLDALLDSELPRGNVLFLLDGLDEVKELGLRNTVVERVRDFYGLHRRQGNKFALTSRIVGYREVRPAAEGLVEGTLVDFDREEIEVFVEKWTSALERAAVGDGQVAVQDAKRERDELLAAIERNPGVRSLAANPLLLTILALMKRQGVTLPERRTELYQTYVETLLRNWNLVRSLAGRSSRDLDLVETLKILAPLALWMHQTSPGVGLVREWDLHQELERIYRERGESDPEAATRHFLDDVRDHAALLLDRGGRQYGFIHLTFQEYLAAVALAQKGQQGVEPIVEALAQHVDEAPWHEVILLTVGYLGIGQKRDEAASAVVEALLDQAPGRPGQAVVLAGRAVADAGSAGVTSACRQRVVEALLRTMRADKVAPVRRAQAGRALADVGDPRPEVMTLDGMEFCRVPAGPFWMGSEDSDEQAWEEEKPLHLCEIPYDYFLARYPVTVTQLRAWAEASGRQSRAPFGLWGWGALNVPAERVNWNDAAAFCEWLTERWRVGGLLKKGWAVCLPSEAEWEKAARGGVKILSRPQVGSLRNRSSNGPLMENPRPHRRYPWGEKDDRRLANSLEAKTRQVSPAGCFAGGASPYGCEEMAGNIWEWTRSLFEPYPYPADLKDRQRREDHSVEGRRVLRGGSAILSSRFMRCAFRNKEHPRRRYRTIGFRVALIQFRPGL